MINDLDDTLTRLLAAGLPASLAGQTQISFAAPDAQFPPQSVTLPAIDLFLYDVRENRELRSNEVYIVRQPGSRAAVTRAPARVDFSYLITAWPSTTITDPWKDEHRLLGEVMRVLLKHATLPAEVLCGELASQEAALPVSCLQPGRAQPLGEFWQAMGGKPKVALNYTVTVAVGFEPEDLPLVVDKRVDLELMRMQTVHAYTNEALGG